MKHQKNPLMPFCMWLLPLSFFAYQFILRLWPSLMMQHIMTQLVIDCTAFGFLSSIYYWGYAGMQIPIAFALNRFETRYVVFSCALLCCIGTLLFSFTSHWYLALLSRFMVGAGSAAGFLSTSQIISEFFPKEQYSKMVGFTFTFGLLGAIYAGKPVNLLINLYGWQKVAFVLGFFPLLIGFLALLFLRIPMDTKSVSCENSLEFKSCVGLLKSPIFMGIAFANLLMVGSLEGFADVWGVNYLMAAYGLDKSAAAQLISFIFVGMLFGGPILAYFGKKIGNYKVISLCGIGMAALFLPLIYINSLNWFILAALFFCIGIMCCYQVIVFAVGADLVSTQSLGMAVALLNSINMLGGSFFHSLIGFAMDMFWTGTMVGQVRSYDLSSYQYSLMIIPLCAILGALLTGVVAIRLRVKHLS